MKRETWAILGCFAVALLLPACFNYEWSSNGERRWGVGQGGATGIWVLANISYAGMRAQNHPSRGWRIAAFIFGFPGTLLTYFCVAEGSNRAYGISFPPNLSGP